MKAFEGEVRSGSWLTRLRIMLTHPNYVLSLLSGSSIEDLRRLWDLEQRQRFLSEVRELSRRYSDFFPTLSQSFSTPIRGENSAEEFASKIAGIRMPRMMPKAQSIFHVGYDTTTYFSMLYLLCRKLRPLVVVETGVRYGFSTLTLLTALKDAGQGHLYSVEIENAYYIAQAVPESLRTRWTLVQGDSKVVLPDLLKTLGTVDMFIHDSKHDYETMSFEYNAAWPFVRPGGLLISDDIEKSAAFSEFVSKHHPKYRILEPGEKSGFGVVFKEELGSPPSAQR